MDFPEKILEPIEKLRNLFKNDFIEIKYPMINITRINKYSGTKVSVKLLYDSVDGTFEIQEPFYSFQSKISYFDFKKPEYRLCRNKDFLFRLIKYLKNCDLWGMVSNQDFIIINKKNKKTNSNLRLKMLKKVLNAD